MSAYLHNLIDTVAAQYARRAPWQDRSELVQVGWTAALEWIEVQPDAADEGYPYLARAVALAIQRWIWDCSSPLGHNLNTHRPPPPLLRAPVEEAIALADPAAGDPEEATARRLWGAKLRHRVAELAADELPTATRTAAYRVVVGERSRSEAATRSRVTLRRVRRAVDQLRHRVASDPIAQKLKEEKP